jgi:hypothetical protein
VREFCGNVERVSMGPSYTIVFSHKPRRFLTLFLGIHYSIYGNKEYSGFFKGGNFNGFGV